MKCYHSVRYIKILNEGGPGGNYIPIQVTTSYLTQFVVLKGGTVQIFYESTSITE